MNKLEQKHLEVVNYYFPAANPLERQGNRIAATSCAEITKEYAEKFDVWKDKNRWEISIDGYYYNIEDSEYVKHDKLWDLFLNDLNEKG